MSADLAVRTERAVAKACDEARSVVELCRNVQRVVAPVIPSDRWCGFAIDPATFVPTNGFHDEGIPDPLLPRLLELEHGTDDCNHLPALARSRAGVATLSQATGGNRAASARWREVLVPCGIDHEMRAVFRDRGRAWGALILMRGPDVDDFSSADVAALTRLAPLVAAGFRRVLVRQQLDHRDDAREAGILVVGGDPTEVKSVTAAAAFWLELLDDGGFGGPLPTSVMSAVHACRNRAAPPVAVRARTRTGRWVTVTAERFSDEDGSDIGVIVQPSRPAEIASIVGAAHGLTERESDVVVSVVAGHTNDEIATLLRVSPHTVKDHLKSIYAKLDVRTRGEMTSKLFYDHYLPREIDQLRVGADGWFLES